MERTMNKKLDLRSEAGFTLMELIVVIAIIAILISILLPRFSGMTDKANSVSAASDARSAFTAFTSYVTSVANAPGTGAAYVPATAEAKMKSTLGLDTTAGATTTGYVIKALGYADGAATATIAITRGGLVYTFTLDTGTGRIGPVTCGGNDNRCTALVGEGIVTAVAAAPAP